MEARLVKAPRSARAFVVFLAAFQTSGLGDPEKIQDRTIALLINEPYIYCRLLSRGK